MSLRIRKLAELVRPGVIPADLGTDHGLLPILLVEQGIAEKAYACDVAEGPLSQAEANILSHGLSGKVIPVLSDGFAAVPEDADAAVIAGMGYYTAVHILECAAERTKKLCQIIAQINDDVPSFRKWILSHGFVIERELNVSERGHFYTMIDFHSGTAAPYSRQELYCGRYETLADHAAWLDWAEAKAKKLKQIIACRNGDIQLETEQSDLLNAIAYIKSGH